MALFPDELVESELGMIPKGWEVKSLSEVSEITKGVSYRSEELSGNEFALVNLKSINRGGGYRLDGLKSFCGTYKNEQEVHHGDIIIAYTDVTQAAELLGRPARVQKVDNTRLIASLDIGIVRSEILPKEFLYFTLNSYRFNEYAKNHANGTTVLHLSRKAVPKFRTVIPSKFILMKFSNICNPLFKIIDSNTYQNNVLPYLRDELIHLFLQN
jgi:type I restriction enzyme S subunit